MPAEPTVQSALLLLPISPGGAQGHNHATVCRCRRGWHYSSWSSRGDRSSTGERITKEWCGLIRGLGIFGDTLTLVAS